MKQTEITETVKNVTMRDWFYYKNQMGYDVTKGDALGLLVVVADQKAMADTGKHDLNRFLDMSLISLQEYLGLEAPDESDDEPVSD